MNRAIVGAAIAGFFLVSAEARAEITVAGDVVASRGTTDDDKDECERVGGVWVVLDSQTAYCEIAPTSQDDQPGGWAWETGSESNSAQAVASAGAVVKYFEGRAQQPKIYSKTVQRSIDAFIARADLLLARWAKADEADKTKKDSVAVKRSAARAKATASWKFAKVEALSLQENMKRKLKKEPPKP